ncbi:DUF5686 and carboxypeptidase regulatory-like domain-containing protein [Filimonas effusa]|uniref:Carboxypeptidase-like regulatory domain-containing protein n=1 Tax=Filimonas effusa TaxID=2508721 RepID=A0A4Q1CZM1_9BACT|nr:DUF5686 and carboxypeptidase regulatory-like domain-containing protein [Filimonas effusa]RXK80766.1 carboxypeptidase-like regulatory domain-containing protein [Filimonas effusa]
MKNYAQLLLLLFLSVSANAAILTGVVTNEKGEPLSYASILIKGTTRGTTANMQGAYTLTIEPGINTIVCQYVGYERQEKKVSVSKEPLTLNFSLLPLQDNIGEVVVKAGGEDPAYAIIRNAIKMRPSYVEPLDSFTSEAYIKMLIKLRKTPDKFMGQKIDEKTRKEMGLDSAGKGVVYLSESLTRLAMKKPGKAKLEVLSGRESGSNGYGFNFPSVINFYENNVNVMSTGSMSRGFVSPVADDALHYYKYKYSGSFYEDGKEISRIKVMPKRKYEPLFSGIINITEGDWRIHSLELLLTKESQLTLIDSMLIKQIQMPLSSDIWQVKDQVISFSLNILGVEMAGSALNVFSKYDTLPQFGEKYFNRVVISYDTGVNKKPKHYWDSMRPVQLEPEELKDYAFKDSIHELHSDPAWVKANKDSIRKAEASLNFSNVFVNGIEVSDYHPEHPWSFSWEPLGSMVEYNAVEGYAVKMKAKFQQKWGRTRRQLSFIPNLRYGTSNTHFYAAGSFVFSGIARNEEGEWVEKRSSWQLSGGKRVTQFNRNEPITPFFNSVYTLLEHRAYMKIYENYFGELRYSKRWDNSMRFNVAVLYEDRLPLENTSNYSFFKKNREFTPNYPYEQLSSQFSRHQAVSFDIEWQYQPGQYYIQMPDRKIAFGSDWPVFEVAYTKGVKDIAGSDVDFDKWRVSIWDNIDLKLKGELSYGVNAGGFLNSKRVPIQDYQHFNGNQLIFAGRYLNSFQLAPYYANSTTASLYGAGHVEYHLKGMLTNKIPLFKRLNWFLVIGSNTFYVNSNNNYVEAFAGLENILGFFRVDFIASYLNGNKSSTGIRIGSPLFSGPRFGRN